MARKPKKLTDAEILAHDCPYCGAIRGERCMDYKGEAREGKPFCMERGRPHVARAKLDRKAAEINAKARAEYGPLFADLADKELTPVTPADLAAKQLAGIRRGVENGGLNEHWARQGLNWITIWHLRHVAAGLIGSEWEAKLWTRFEGTYRTNLPYIVDAYRQALCTTDRRDLEYVRHEDRVEPSQWNPKGIRYRLEVTAAWPPAGYVPVMTREEFDARFQLKHIFWTTPTDLPEPDDGGLFERVMGMLGAGRSQAA